MNPGDPMGGGGVPPGGSSTLPMAVRRRDEVDGRTASQRQAANGAKDCFIIPQGNLERFLPDGITIPRGPPRPPPSAAPPRGGFHPHPHLHPSGPGGGGGGHHNQAPASAPLINIMEVEDPKLAITFHMIGPLTSLTPHLDSPLATPASTVKRLAHEELARAKDLNANEGYLLKNMEKDSEYPYINYFVIQRPRDEVNEFYRVARSEVYDAFCPTKLGYKCEHSIDLYTESATIARPPVDPLSKRPVGDLTGYIVCVYRVFKGDDGEKFERNWLYWTGARMLYKNLPKAVGLRRITLHKSISCDREVVYLLLVECSHFMDHIGEAANLLPVLRARICGYTGIYRVTESF